MTNLEILECIKLHDKRKKYLSKTFNVPMKKIQKDTDELILYIKSLNSLTVNKSDILTFAETNTDTFFYQFFDWENTLEYRNLQMNIVIGEKSILFSSNNEMIIISPN